MDVTLVAVGFVLIWGTMWFFDMFLKSCLNVPYLWLLDKSGLSIRPFQLKWHTTYFNRTFHRLGTKNLKFLRIWFNMGTFACLITIIPAVSILAYTLKNSIFPTKHSISHQVLTPVVPGFNIPLSDTVYFLLAIILSSAFHEMGHAVAAVREHVTVLGFGMMVLGILPAAFVDIPTEKVACCSPGQQLRIFCAGVWHNIILAAFAVIVILLLPYIFTVGYIIGSGIIVTHVQQNSPVIGPTGLEVWDHIIAVNDCPVTSQETFYNCVKDVYDERLSGFCVKEEFVKSFHWSRHGPTDENVDCCPKMSTSGLCFEDVIRGNALKSCLPAREVTKQQLGGCNISTSCDRFSQKLRCLIPDLDNRTRFLRIVRSNKDDMLYVGDAAGLYFTVWFSDYTPRSPYIWLQFPSIIENFLHYLASISAAFAVLNAVPCFGLDGQWIVFSTLEAVAKTLSLSRNSRKIIYKIITAIGTVLVVATVGTSIASVL